MAYGPPITIKQAVDNISKRHYVLPSLRLDFVWDTEKIEKFFDSLMCDYPIGIFLFWKVGKNEIMDFKFYEFLKNYHEKNNSHNRKAELNDNEDILALLDGQQRMTSLYVALTGSYAKRIPRYRRNSAHVYTKKKMYLNLLQPFEGFEVEYDFKFLTEKEARPTDEVFWFECGKILDFQDLSEVMAYIRINGLTDKSKHKQENITFAIGTLHRFFNVVHCDQTIIYYLQEGKELDNVLQIFIRINWISKEKRLQI